MAVCSIHDDLEMLCETLNLSKSAAFLFAVSESGPMQQQLMRQVQGYLLAQERKVLEVRLSPDQTDIMPEEKDISEQINKKSPPIVFVEMKGFEDAGMMSPSLPQDSSLRMRSENARMALQRLNMQRERLVHLGLPVVFWLNSSTMSQVVQHAADLFAARSGIFYLPELQPRARDEVLMAHSPIMPLERRSLSLLPPEELRRRSALYEKRLEEEKSKEAPNLPGIALLYRDLASIWHELGDYERAGGFQKEEVEIYRALAKDNVRSAGVFGPLAGSLNRLGLRLSDLGRHEEALEVIRQSLEIYQELVKTSHQTFQPDLAASLNNLGSSLSNLGRREEALKAAQEAADIYRKLAEANAQAFLPNLAISLSNLGNSLSDLGQRKEALETAQEAVDIYRKLADANAQAFLPNLATSLGSCGRALLALGEHARAARVFREGLEHLMPFYQILPQSFSRLAGNLLKDYLEACRQAGEEPDEDLMARFKSEKPEG